MGIRLIDVDETVAVPFDTPIALVRPDERYALTVYGTQVTYRRIPIAENIRILERSQRARNGQSSERLNNTLALQYAILDWQGLEDTHGQPVACPIPITEQLLSALPNIAKNTIPGVLDEVWPAGLPWNGKPPARLLVRRIFSHEMDTIRAEQTIRGLLNGQVLWREALALCLKSWENVYDQGHPVPLDEEARARLPIQVYLRAFNTIVAAEIAHEAAMGNFATPSSVT